MRIPDALPKIPRKKKQDCEAKERLRFLLKRRALLNGELHEKELQIKRLGHLGVTYAEICNGVGYVIQQQLQLASSRQAPPVRNSQNQRIAQYSYKVAT